MFRTQLRWATVTAPLLQDLRSVNNRRMISAGQMHHKRKKKKSLQQRLKEEAKRERNKRTWRIIKGDQVFVCGRQFGNDENPEGAIGTVKRVHRLKELAYVAGVNEQEQTVINRETGEETKVVRMVPIHYDNLRLLDPVDGQPTGSRIEFDESGNKVRVSKRSGEIIPWPERKIPVHQTHDKDTLPEDVLEVTYNGR